MTSKEIRSSFFNFFESKGHTIVESAPMVIKDDPTLMFTNAGMNQFKNIFIGGENPKNKRVSNTQKCLRVSGKHNDLDEVGHDTYHHTMFEMLGNWSFGDYFKQEAIDYAWEYLTEVLKIEKYRLYISVFGGSTEDNQERDNEASDIWLKHVSIDRIIDGSKKDNFWEMGEIGPCGPCSEIHIDLRSDAERKEVDGFSLVNKDHPLVIEVWNLVFIQYNRNADKSLIPLPAKHVDTGMGLERLCMAMQSKKSNYDTDVFQPMIIKIGEITDNKYGTSKDKDVAMRVISDHIRAISFSIADGQLPSNNKAGYVIRRILRRAVRYGYTFLNIDTPFMYKLVPTLIDSLGETFPELEAQKTIIEKVIREEEISFLRTLDTGIKLLDKIINDTKEDDFKVIPGKVAFELYDTYGFPLDLTELILREQDLVVNRREFASEMEKQKARSRSATSQDTGDWIEVRPDDVEEFIGYDILENEVTITKYREVKTKKGKFYQLLFNITPFYGESGGQVGDTGYIFNDQEKIEIYDVKTEHNVIVHLTKKLPANIKATFTASVNKNRRRKICANHSATHLLQKALKEVLGDHIEQKGSLVNDDHLRFDFSHFQKLEKEEIRQVELKVNSEIRKNIKVNEQRSIPVDVAKQSGAVALFGEKYGDLVRVIHFGDSVELCGGTHVNATGEIGFFKIVSESAIAAGIRRMEAITNEKCESYINEQFDLIASIQGVLKDSKDIFNSVSELAQSNTQITKQLEAFKKEALTILKKNLINKTIQTNGVNLIAEKIQAENAGDLRTLCFQLKEDVDNLVVVLAAEIDNKANIAIYISESLTSEKDWNAGKIIREVSKEIKGGGGGQAFFATAGGKDPQGILKAIEKAKTFFV